MEIHTIAFGHISEITGKEFRVNAHDIESLKTSLLHKFPGLSNKKFEIAVNKKLVSDNQTLTQYDIVALMPPYSGG